MSPSTVPPAGAPTGPICIPHGAELQPETIAALQRICRVRRVAAGATVVAESERAAFVGCVMSGILRMQKTLADGRQHIVGLLVPGDMFGRVFDGAADHAIEAATDTVFCAYPRAPFEELLTTSPDLDRAVLLNMLDELDRARDWMLLLSNQKVADRLAGFLLLLCTRFADLSHPRGQDGEGLELWIPISRLDLAHLLGSRPESISRAFHLLQDEGEIEILEPDHVVLHDIAALAARTGTGDDERLSGIEHLFAAAPAAR